MYDLCTRGKPSVLSQSRLLHLKHGGTRSSFSSFRPVQFLTSPHHGHGDRSLRAYAHPTPDRILDRSTRQPLSRNNERKAASTTDVYGRRSSGSGGVGAPGGDERGPSSRHASGTSGAGGDGFRLNLERAITTRMQEQLQVHR